VDINIEVADDPPVGISLPAHVSLPALILATYQEKEIGGDVAITYINVPVLLEQDT
jgi:hypothetical protein